jgi:uncharacterized protein YqeY
MNNKKLLNERILALAGIKTPQIMGLSSNSHTLNETDGTDETEAQRAYKAGKKAYNTTGENRGSDQWGPYDSHYQRGWNDAQQEKKSGLNENDYEGQDSECCGAAIHMGDICSKCGEHTEPYDETQDDPMGYLGTAQPNPPMSQWKGLGESVMSQDDLDDEFEGIQHDFISLVPSINQQNSHEIMWDTMEELESLIKNGYDIDSMIRQLRDSAESYKQQNDKKVAARLTWLAHTLDSEIRSGLNEQFEDQDDLDDELDNVIDTFISKIPSINQQNSHDIMWGTMQELEDVINSGLNIDSVIAKINRFVDFYKNKNDKKVAARLTWLAHTLDSEIRSGALNEATIRETIGLTKHITRHKPHGKNLINERFLGIVGLKPIGGLVGSPKANSFKPKLKEVKSDLSRAKLYQSLPMLHSNSLIGLAEELNIPTGQKWDVILEDITKAYFAGGHARELINNTLKMSGLI